MDKSCALGPAKSTTRRKSRQEKSEKSSMEMLAGSKEIRKLDKKRGASSCSYFVRSYDLSLSRVKRFFPALSLISNKLSSRASISNFSSSPFDIYIPRSFGWKIRRTLVQVSSLAFIKASRYEAFNRYRFIIICAIRYDTRAVPSETPSAKGVRCDLSFVNTRRREEVLT